MVYFDRSRVALGSFANGLVFISFMRTPPTRSCPALISGWWIYLNQ